MKFCFIFCCVFLWHFILLSFFVTFYFAVFSNGFHYHTVWLFRTMLLCFLNSCLVFDLFFFACVCCVQLLKIPASCDAFQRLRWHSPSSQFWIISAIYFILCSWEIIESVCIDNESRHCMFVKEKVEHGEVENRREQRGRAWRGRRGAKRRNNLL